MVEVTWPGIAAAVALVIGLAGLLTKLISLVSNISRKVDAWDGATRTSQAAFDLCQKNAERICPACNTSL